MVHEGRDGNLDADGGERVYGGFCTFRSHEIGKKFTRGSVYLWYSRSVDDFSLSYKVSSKAEVEHSS
ncbi:unnamed protein product [Calypogeia fissa]